MSHLPWHSLEKEKIVNAAVAGRLSHALNISATRGTGVFQFAKQIAAIRLCSQGLAKGEACGECKSCQLLTSNTHPDLIMLEPEGAAGMIKIDQVRALVEQMSKTPQVGEWKVAILSPADRLNQNASNALLKVLEEPPGQSLLILATERPQVLMPTLRSRCAHVGLSNPTIDQTLEYLTSVNAYDVQLIERALSQLGAKPILIDDWFKSDLMNAWHALIEKIQRFESNQAGMTEVVAATNGIDASVLVNWLIDYSSKQMKSSVMHNKQSFELYENSYAKLLELKREIDSGANPNIPLSLETILIHWPRN